MNSRELILRVMTAYDRRPGNLERLIEHALSGLHIDHRDRRLIFEVVYGIVRRKATLDYLIGRTVTDEKKREDPHLRRLLRIGLYQLLYLDRVPDHASVNETVKLAGGNPRTKGFTGIINAVMRSVINNKKQIELPDPQKQLTERLAVEFSHPKWMIERWMKRIGLTHTKRLLAFNNEKPQIYLRRTLRMMSRQHFESDVRLICDSATGYMDLYYRLKKALVPEQLQLLQQGFCTIQAPSSGWVVALLDVRRGEHVIDLCSAPGGKSSLISELAGDEGTVCACEINRNRLQKVTDTAVRMGLRNVYPLVTDGASPPFNGFFDKVLLDAPCTATGVLHRHPEARWIRTIDDISRLSSVQRTLLDAAARLVGRDGIVVYSTCSLEPEENEDRVAEFLEKHPGFALDPLPSSIPEKYADGAYLRITPYEHGMDGMFAARLRCLEAEGT